MVMRSKISKAEKSVFKLSKKKRRFIKIDGAVIVKKDNTGRPQKKKIFCHLARAMISL